MTSSPPGPAASTTEPPQRSGPRRASQVRTAADVRSLARNRLIESRLTPNAISMTGFALNVAAAVLVTQRLFFLAGLAFVVGSVMDTLDGRYSRMSGKGTVFGAFFEPAFQHWAMGMSWLINIADWAYVNTHFVVTMAFLIWLYLARNKAFYFVRNMFMIAMGLALVGYMAYPVAPPRLLPEWGFTDTVTNAVGYQQANTAKLLFNPYAAMPSMHVAFALMIAIPAVKLITIRALRVAWAFYPAFVAFVVIVTAKVPRPWEDQVNGTLTDGAKRYKNAVILDWHNIGGAHPEYFYDDAIHLRPEGAATYAELVATAIG